MGFQLLLKCSPSLLCLLLTKLKVKGSRAGRQRKRERVILQECKTKNNIFFNYAFRKHITESSHDMKIHKLKLLSAPLVQEFLY